MTRDKCRSCGDAILWAETEKGKMIPINVDPDHDGNMMLLERSDPRDPLIAKVIPKGIAVEPDARYKSHFATCAQAEEWRTR